MSKENRREQRRRARRSQAETSSALSQILTRRTLLALTALGGLSILGICSAPKVSNFLERQKLIDETEASRQASEKTYAGPNSTLQGEKYLPSDLLVNYVQALQNTKHPFLNKIARDIVVISGPQPHPELSSLVAVGTSAPLPILETNSTTSTVSSAPRYTSETATYVEGNDRKDFRIIESMESVITIGTKPPFKDASTLGQSLFLAKEMLSLAMIMSYERDYASLLEGFGSGKFLHSDGSRITDPTFKQRAGASLFHDQLTNDTSSTWKSVDALPILLLGVVGRELSSKRLFSKKDDNVLGGFSDNEVRLQPATREQLSRFMDQWTRSNTLLLNNNLVRESASGALLAASLNVK